MLLAIEFDNLHQILRSLYTDMMPLCGNMAGVAKGIAGLGALFYVAAKVWQSLASAEPIDVYPEYRNAQDVLGDKYRYPVLRSKFRVFYRHCR